MGIREPAALAPTQIYFDGACMLCRNLAFLLQKTHRQSLEVRPLQELEPNKAKIDLKLLVQHQETWYEDLEAWEFLLQEIPSIRSLAWMPVKIFGLQKTASAFKKSSERLRKLCRRCF